MTLKPEKHITPLSHFFNYLKNRLYYSQKHTFEKRVLKDTFESDALDGFAQFDEETILKDVDNLYKQIVNNQSKRSKSILITYLKIAASIVIILALTRYLFTLNNSAPELITDNIELENKSSINENSLEEATIPQPSSTIKGGDKSQATPLKNKRNESLSSKRIESNTPKTDNSSTLNINKTTVVAAPINQTKVATTKENSFLANNKASEFNEVDTQEVSLKKTTKAKLTKPTKNYRVTGTVLDELGIALPGVSITVQGTAQGTVTDIDGNYSLQNIDSTSTLEYAFIGYATKEEKADSNVNLIHLEPDMIALDEVVAIGYGTTKRRDLTGSVSSISVEEKTCFLKRSSAHPQGGHKAFKKYILENQILPSDSIIEKVVVALTVEIDTNGQIIDIKVEDSPSSLFTQEAIRLINNGPKWLPAIKNGKRIESKESVQIVFKPKK